MTIAPTPTPTLTRRNQGYDLLRIASILAVVAIHTFGPTAANQEIRPSADWGLALAFSAGSVWAVPVFVMLSGALSLTERAHSDGPLRFYAKRATRIIPALIGWHLVYLVGIRMILLRQEFSLTQLIEAFIDMSIYPHLYFLWLITGLYVFAPVLAAFLEKGGQKRALVLAGCALGFSLLVYLIPGVLSLFEVSRPIRFSFLTIWLPYVGYFIAGYALSRIAVSRKVLLACGVGAVALAVLVMAQVAFPAQMRVVSAFATPEYLGVGVALLAICVFLIGTRALNHLHLPERINAWVVSLSEASFGVYLVHLIVLLVPYYLLQGFKTQQSIGEAMLAYVVILIVSFAISTTARRIPWVRMFF